MSYSAVPRSNYLTFQPETPFESGAPGWSTAPYPGWGNNPNQMLPFYLAGLGEDAVPAPESTPPAPPVPGKVEWPLWPALLMYGVAAAVAYGTYRLSRS
jgi:hypothetical protein